MTEGAPQEQDPTAATNHSVDSKNDPSTQIDTVSTELASKAAELAALAAVIAAKSAEGSIGLGGGSSAGEAATLMDRAVHAARKSVETLTSAQAAQESGTPARHVTRSSLDIVSSVSTVITILVGLAAADLAAPSLLALTAIAAGIAAVSKLALVQDLAQRPPDKHHE